MSRSELAEEVMDSLLPPHRPIRHFHDLANRRVRWEDGDCGIVSAVDAFRREITVLWDSGTMTTHMYGGGNTLPLTYEEREPV